MKLLCIDASTMAAGAAILDEDTVIAENYTHYKQKHSEKLLPMIDHLLIDAKLTRAHIDAIALGVGPGSFTGVRIACATAKGLAFALGLPIAPVCSPAAVIWQNRLFDGDVFCMFDAGSDEVYLCRGKCRGGDVLEMTQVKLAALEEAKALLLESTHALLAGDALYRHRDSFSFAHVQLAPEETRLPRAYSIGQLARRQNNFQPAADVFPHYIKQFQPGRPKHV